MSKNNKTSSKKPIIIGSVALVTLIAIVTVMVLVLGKNNIGDKELKGAYSCTLKGQEYTYVLDDGTYVLYKNGIADENYHKAGTYSVVEDKITFVTMSGAEIPATFDAKKNFITIDGNKYKSDDINAKLGFKLEPNYLDGFLDKVNGAAAAAFEKHPEVLNNAYKLDYEAMMNPSDAYVAEFAELLGFNSDETMQALFRLTCIQFVTITFDENGLYAASYNFR